MNMREARAAFLPGWNLRCNLCGEYPANWIADMRPGIGALALCDQHRLELEKIQDDYKKSLEKFRLIKFEQLSEFDFRQELKRIKKGGEMAGLDPRTGKILTRARAEALAAGRRMKNEII